MTNAIEQTKREMCDALEGMKGKIQINYSINDMLRGADWFEGQLESYLELLRQDHEALHETARKRFEDLQVAEAKSEELAAGLASANEKMESRALHSLETIRKLEVLNQDLLAQNKRFIDLHGKLREERDAIQLRLHAVDHAYKTQQDRAATPTKDSGDRASCATPDAKTMALLGALVDAQRIMTEYLVPDGIRAKDAIGKLIPVLDNEKLCAAMDAFERKPESDEEVMARRRQEIAKLEERHEHDMAKYAQQKRDNEQRSVQLLNEISMIGFKANLAVSMALAGVPTGDKCQHSFFAIGQDQMKCTFCGVGK